eukprot:683802-Rhodomonas_salina.1
MHRQSVTSSLPAAEIELSGQLVRHPPQQNVSAGHCSHSPPAGPENPLLQMQSACSELPGSELLLTGHWFVTLPPGHQYPAEHS